MRLLFLGLVAIPVLAQTPRYSQPEALWAEWRRQAPAFTERQLENMPLADRARWELSVRRIQGIVAPPLLPPELDKPTEALWLEKAAQAKEPGEIFDAFYFLNRLRSAKSMDAFANLAIDGSTVFGAWPKHLRLDAQFTAALLAANDASQIEKIAIIMDSYRNSMQRDPVREMVLWLRLSMAGREVKQPEPIEATPHAILALMDAWNRAPWAKRSELLPPGKLNLEPGSAFWPSLGLKPPSAETLALAHVGIMARLAEGVPNPAPKDWAERIGAPQILDADLLARWYGFQSLDRFAELPSEMSKALDSVIKDKKLSPLLRAMLLPALYKHRPKLAQAWRDELLAGKDPIARSLAVEHIKEAPKEKDLEALIKRVWRIEEYDSVQGLINAMPQWKLPTDKHQELLKKFLSHPSWTARLDAWRELRKLDPAAAWPKVPEPATKIDQDIMSLAQELLRKGEAVRIQVDFRDHGSVVMSLDPINAPMNVANLVILARRGFFDGRRVPRIVPDFVVQMGSPCDTMDGGPGYNVRCENSLHWYGPGSVGMALSGMDTGGCQFFFTLNATPHLTGKYTRVGELENLDEAMKVLESLELGAVIERVGVI
ncbi:MAG: peptidylprolyl isomerase [Holophagales bacterium]|nr:peptidylprolyl isomerase [Holophagales bacterium]